MLNINAQTLLGKCFCRFPRNFFFAVQPEKGRTCTAHTRQRGAALQQPFVQATQFGIGGKDKRFKVIVLF
jgi:hypothetical protein